MFIVIRSRRIVAILLILVAAQISLTAFLCVKQFAGNSVSLIDFTVVIDAGHGGIDGGVVSSSGIKEASLNLAYSKTLGKIFEQSGFNVIYTRKTEDGLYGLPTKGFKSRDMKARKEIILNAKPNVVISVHMNKYSSSYRTGPQVFYQEGKEDGKQLAASLQRVFNDNTGNSHEAIAGDYYICREVDCPSVIVECGFLSNEGEAALLNTEEYRELLCGYVYSGVMLYLYQ